MSTTAIAAETIDAAGQIILSQGQELREAHAQNLGLRAILAEHGIDVPVPSGVVTLARLRALENVLDLARLHLRAPTPETESALRDATVAAGRQP